MLYSISLFERRGLRHDAYQRMCAQNPGLCITLVHDCDRSSANDARLQPLS